jgi:hypothetical protein
MGRAADAPAHDAVGIGVDEEGDVDEALLARNVGEVRQPQRVRTRRVELPLHPVERTGGCRVADGGSNLPAATTPCRPILRIRRATVHRATCFPSRPSCRQIVRTP